MDTGHIEIAKSLMKEIQYDNGWINAVDGDEKYPQIWVDKIALAAGRFFDRYPDFLTNEVIEDITCGEYSENQSKYGHLKGYPDLAEVLNEYFDNPQQPMSNNNPTPPAGKCAGVWRQASEQMPPVDQSVIVQWHEHGEYWRI